MAILKESSGGTGLMIDKLPPPGQYLGVCVKISDQFGVEREKFQGQGKEIRDVTRFVFGVKDPTSAMFLVQTFEFRISGASGSNLMEFLAGWLGRTPQFGWDYCEMLGKGAMLSVEHKASRTNAAKVYANVVNISPVFPQLLASVPNKDEFAAMLAAAERPNFDQHGGPTNSAPQQYGAAPQRGFQPYTAPAPAMPATPPPMPAPPPAAHAPADAWVVAGWKQHPHNPNYWYLGQTVLTLSQLKEKFAPVAPATPPPMPAPPPPMATAPLPFAPAAGSPPPTGEVPF